MPEPLTDLDKRLHRTVHHPVWCRLTDDDCWSVLNGDVAGADKGIEECKQCMFGELNVSVHEEIDMSFLLEQAEGVTR